MSNDERHCKNCKNLKKDKDSENKYYCTEGVFDEELWEDIKDEEHADHCGRKYQYKGKNIEESKFEKYLSEAKSKEYAFVIDADERGEFSAHIEDENGKIKFNWSKDDCEEAGGFPPVVDGYMKNIKDMNGLRDYLKLPNLLWVG